MGGVDFFGDSDGSFTELVGQALDLNSGALGPAKRSQRYSMLVDNGVVAIVHRETSPGDMKVSDGRTMLKSISGHSKSLTFEEFVGLNPDIADQLTSKGYKEAWED